MPVSENFVPPNQQRNLRACMVCSIVMTQNVSLSSYRPLSPPLSTNYVSRDSSKKDAPTATNSCISKAPWTPSSTARLKSSKGSSHSPTRRNLGLRSGSVWMAMLGVFMQRRSPVCCRMRSWLLWRMRLGYVIFRTLICDIGIEHLLMCIAVVTEVLRRRIDNMMRVILELIHGS